MRSLPVSKNLYLSNPAKLDMKLIGDYISREWGAVQKKKYLAQVKRSFNLICESPAIGKSRDEIDMGLMSHAIQKHIVFYRATEDQLFVLRVLHESMDLEWHLK